MAYPAPDRMTLLPFPQQWELRDGGTTGVLHLRAVVLPRGNPLQPLITATPGVPDGPAFADATLGLRALIIPSLEQLPDPAQATTAIDLPPVPPGDRRSWFETLAAEFVIDPALEAATVEPRRAGRQVKKLLVPSYTTAFAFPGPRTPFAVLDDSYACALRRSCTLDSPQGPPPLTTTTWGRVVAQALRQPVLAQRLGLLQIVEVELPAVDLLAQGGWLHLTLGPASDHADHAAVRPEVLASYAARIPALEQSPRQVFAPVLFPVAAVPPAGDYDELHAEATSYDDGFARIVHAFQPRTAEPAGLEGSGIGAREDDGEPGRQGAPLPPVRDTGISIGWDDEQLVVWMNRQLASTATETRQAPMGVLGYRVDVRETGSPAWTSLLRVRGDLAISGRDLGTFDGELHVEVGPVQLDNAEDGDYWMPAYFTSWSGGSLVADDELTRAVSGGLPSAGPAYEAVGVGATPLRYGRDYDLRVRLVDLSSGGPSVEHAPLEPGPSPTAACRFRRWVPPGLAAFGDLDPPDPATPPGQVEVFRPRLAHPAAAYTATDLSGHLLADVARIEAEGLGDVPTAPDPDVDMLEITVRIAGLEYDAANDPSASGGAALRRLYVTTRPFPADVDAPLVLPLAWADAADATLLTAPADGALPVPRARDVFLDVRAIGRADPTQSYFGADAVRTGDSARLPLRADPDDESGLFAPQDETDRLRAALLAPEEPVTPTLATTIKVSGRGVSTERDALSLLADAFDLRAAAEGMTLTGRPGVRTVFGSSAGVSGTVAPDASTFTVTSGADLADKWVVAVSVLIDRDWTWDALEDTAFVVSRAGVGRIGAVRLPRSVNPAVAAGERVGSVVDRSRTRVVFLDCVDPSPTPPGHPEELRLDYTVEPAFRRPPVTGPDPVALGIDLPIASPPTQTPRLTSAGVALSPYVRSLDYSRTEVRERLLWVEFDAPPEHPGDALFGRVLSYAPDPMLTGDASVTTPPEPPLPLDPEAVRVIRPGQSDDRAGLGAMQRLLPTDSDRHWLLPLPPGLTRDSLELFGFFTYEFRVGHVVGWSTARARFGPALRVTGVQHPCPALHCRTARVQDAVIASVDHATAVHEGRQLVPRPPATRLWLMLYAQVVQADGADRRNVLVSRRLAWMRRQGREFPDERVPSAEVRWTEDEVEAALLSMGLPYDSPLSVLGVEVLPEAVEDADPLGSDLGSTRVLRTSPLVPVPVICPEPVCR